MKGKIFSNYKIVENNSSISRATKIPKVAKNTKVDLSKKIAINEDRLNNEKVIHKKQEKKEPIININRNEDGVITSIDVVCETPATFTIDFDYS